MVRVAAPVGICWGATLSSAPADYCTAGARCTSMPCRVVLIGGTVLAVCTMVDARPLIEIECEVNCQDTCIITQKVCG